MNIGSILSLVCFFVGFAGLLFIAFLNLHEKCCKQCVVHWKDSAGVRSYSITKACTKSGASRIARKNPEVSKVTKVVMRGK